MTYDSKGKISIIIPILNEAGTVGEIMDNLEKLRGDFEIIFVDGGSDDGTDTMVEKRYSMVRSPRKGRSFQMNYGALLAQGSILLFLHADCRLSEDALDKIRCEISKGSKV
ncbi:MAG TPA: glycosyltransferase, partial [Tissierellaceae bacterium]|nr:glycosyltransferase [Tissierellaceae bacterium]